MPNVTIAGNWLRCKSVRWLDSLESRVWSAESRVYSPLTLDIRENHLNKPLIDHEKGADKGNV